MRRRRMVKRGSVEPSGDGPRSAVNALPGGSTKPHIVNAFWSGPDLFLVERGGWMRRLRAEHACFIRRKQLTRTMLRDLQNSRTVQSVATEGDWIRIRWVDKRACERGCEWLTKHKNVQTYDGNVSPVRRYIAENGITPAQPRLCYLDIETDSRLPFSQKELMRVLVWCVVDAETGATHTGTLTADTDDAERHLLEQLWTVLDGFDQVAAWNGDRFDFPVIKARTEHVGIDRIEWRRWLWLDHLDLFRRMNTMAAESGDEKTSFALHAIAMAVLGHGKDDFDASKTWEAWENGDTRLVPYCIKDTLLMRELEEKTGYIALLQTLCEATGTFADSRGINPSVQVEGFLSRLGIERGHRFETKERVPDSELGKYRGAFVMEPTDKGIVKDVHVADFASLYPSIIISWNMSQETRRKSGGEGRSHAPIVDTYFDTSQPGMLALAVTELLRLRKYWNDEKSKHPPGTEAWKDADRRSTAYKIAANSFYGVAGSPMSRFFDRATAEAITQAGVWLIKETIKAAEQRGMRVVYGDTDSLFVVGCTRQEFEAFVAWCNAELYPKLLAQCGCIENRIKLAYEKQFERIVFVTAKRYAGRYAHYKGTAATAESKPEVKGLEYKRGDSVRLARQMQEESVKLLMTGVEDPAPFQSLLTTWRDRVLNAPLELDDVVIGKRLTKDIAAYSRRKKKDGGFAAQLPHIEIARQLEARGFDVGEGVKIRYVITDGKARPKKCIAAEDWNGDVDRHELWDGLVAPATLRLLAAAFPGADWSPWAHTRPTPARKRRKATDPAQGAPRAPGATTGSPGPSTPAPGGAPWGPR